MGLHAIYISIAVEDVFMKEYDVFEVHAHVEPNYIERDQLESGCLSGDLRNNPKSFNAKIPNMGLSLSHFINST